MADAVPIHSRQAGYWDNFLWHAGYTVIGGVAITAITVLGSKIPYVGPFVPGALSAVAVIPSAIKTYNQIQAHNYKSALLNGVATGLFAIGSGIVLAGAIIGAPVSVPVIAGVSLTTAAFTGGFGLMVGEQIHDNWDYLAGMFGYDKSQGNPDLKKVVLNLPKPDQLKDPNWAHMLDAEGNFAKLVEICANDKFIDNQVLSYIDKLSPNQMRFIVDPQIRETMNTRAQSIAEELSAALADSKILENLKKDPEFMNLKQGNLKSFLEHSDPNLIKDLNFDDLVKLQKAVIQRTEPIQKPNQRLEPEQPQKRAEIVPPASEGLKSLSELKTFASAQGTKGVLAQPTKDTAIVAIQQPTNAPALVVA